MPQPRWIGDGTLTAESLRAHRPAATLASEPGPFNAQIVPPPPHNAMVLGAPGEHSALAEALFWAERIGLEVYGGSVPRAERDAAAGWRVVTEWGQHVTQTEVTMADWASFWLGHRSVPGWPDDDAEAERWAHHLPLLGVQVRLALRLFARRLVRMPKARQTTKKAAFFLSLRRDAPNRCDVLRVQLHKELRAAAVEREVERGDLLASHLDELSHLGAGERTRACSGSRRPTVRRLAAMRTSKS